MAAAALVRETPPPPVSPVGAECAECGGRTSVLQECRATPRVRSPVCMGAAAGPTEVRWRQPYCDECWELVGESVWRDACRDEAGGTNVSIVRVPVSHHLERRPAADAASTTPPPPPALVRM